MGAAHLERGRGRLEDAARLYGRALELAREAVASGLDNRAVRVAMVVTLRELGHVSEERGDEEGAQRCQEEGLAWARRVGEPRLLARTMEGLAGALSLGSRATEAARLLGAAEGARAAVHAQLPSAEGENLVRVSRRLRDRLGDACFEAELAVGRAEYVAQAETTVAPTLPQGARTSASGP